MDRPAARHALEATRRHFLQGCGLGLGALAFRSLLAREAGLPAPSGRARHIIYLHMSGAPPQHDTFDCKPKLQELNGQLCPKEFLENRRLAFIKGHPTLLGSPHSFRPMGREGLLVSELLPHFESIVDRVTVVRSAWTDQFNHAPAEMLLYTGRTLPGYASLGSWISWGLGSLNDNLPAFVVLVSGESDPTGGKSLWSAGFLPSEHQGVRFRSQGEPVLFVSNPDGMPPEVRRRSLDALRDLNEAEAAATGDPETRARIEQYELAWRMQSTVPEVTDLSREPQEILDEYGAVPGQASLAANCLLARRLVEQGVRYVQLYDWGWDIHGTGPGDDLVNAFPKKCAQMDRPVAALVRDLDRRGLLDETLVIWGGEFGRTSMNEKRNGSTYLGRDHHPDCFTIWLAGAGIHRGRVYGETDELGWSIVSEDEKLGIRDLQATILHLAGLDPFTTRYPFQGLEQRLIGPAEGPRIATELFS